jgi:3-hydroxy-D-aspartate aldolase
LRKRDNVYDRVGLRFKCALTILATVIHKRPGMAITDAGLKVCTTEQGPPTIKGCPHLKMHGELSEEHGLIEDPGDELEYLQKVEYIPSHGCTTVNLHDRFYCIRNDMLEAVWPIAGRGKSR